MIEQASGSSSARSEVDLARASNTMPPTAQDFAQVFAGLLSDRAQPPPGITQVVRNELKNPNQVNLASIASDELTNPSQPPAGQTGTRTLPGQPRPDSPPPAQAPPGGGQSITGESASTASPRPALRSSGAHAQSAQSSPTDAQPRPAGAHTPAQSRTPGVASPPAPDNSAACVGAGAAARGATRIDALAGLSRAGPRTDHRAAASAFKRPSQPVFQVEKQQLTSQVSRSLASIIARGGGKLTLRLSPHAMGDVRVELEVREGAASALFRAEHESARDLLRSNLDALRNALEKRGVRVERLEVVGPHSESTAPASESDRIDGKESGSSGQQQPWHGGSTGRTRRAPAEAGGGNMFEPEAEPGSETGPCVMVQRSIEGTVLRLDAIA